MSVSKLPLIPENWCQRINLPKKPLPATTPVSPVSSHVRQQAKKYGLRALHGESQKLQNVSDTPGDRNQTLNTSVFLLATLAAPCGLTKELVYETLSGATEHWQTEWTLEEFDTTFQSAWVKGIEQPRGLAHLTNTVVSPTTSIISGTELLKKEFKPINWIVPNLLPEGLTIVAGKPKAGKSWLAMGIGIEVAKGGYALGEWAQSGEVLYAALEDNERRLQDRLRKLSGNASDFDNLKFITQMPRTNEGGLEWLAQYIADSPNLTLIIIDTLQRVKPPGKAGANAYAQDYDALAPLQKLAIENSVGIIVITHTRKQEAADPYDRVTGTQGQNGVADSIWVLERDRNQGMGKLHITGRDVEEQELGLEFDEAQCRWINKGPAWKQFASPEQKKIYDYLKSVDKPYGPKEIAQAIGGNKDSVKHLLRKMCGLWLTRVGHGQYQVIGWRDGDTEVSVQEGDLFQSPFQEPTSLPSQGEE